MIRSRLISAVVLAVVATAWFSACGATTNAAEQKFVSHPPTRPLPVPSARPLAAGPNFFVDAAKGDDTHDGSQAKPWRTLQVAIDRLRPGDTLYLRGGTFYEHVTIRALATAAAPITIRAFPNELAIVDGGLREFFESPATAWEPFSAGAASAAGEFRSTKTYPGLGQRESETSLLGNFGDSLVPLHGYHFVNDLRTDNPFWNLDSKVGDAGAVYCGPGVYYDSATQRIHVRLAHTKLPGLHDDNYRGETDPRRIPLVIAGHASGSVIALEQARHVRLQDLVVRGARVATLDVRDCADIELDGLTVYGGSSPISVRDTAGLRVIHTACRGLAAPWTFRGSLKYRAIESRLFSASGWDPTGADNRDLEIAYSEFTDSVDGVFIGNVRRVRFHHNLVDNVSDDGIFLTAATGYDGVTHGGDFQIYQNRLSRCLTVFAFGVGHGRQRTIASGKQLGAGAYIFRNVFDFRRPVMYRWPNGPDDKQELDSYGRFGGDHGSPGWEPMWIYHNTLLVDAPDRGEYGSFGISHGLGHGTQRRVFNNIFCLIQGQPGTVLPNANSDFQTDGNLLWSVTDGASFSSSAELFAKFRNSPAFAESQKTYKPGWTTNDRWADPRFVSLETDWKKSVDLHLQKDSPAVNAGVEIPNTWPDPLRASDSGQPDLGAIPVGSQSTTVGVYGRLDLFGRPTPPDFRSLEDFGSLSATAWSFPNDHADVKPELKLIGKPALVYCGYPAFDAPLIAFALRRAGVPVEKVEQQWLDVREFSKYQLVAIDGSFPRAKIEPNKFNATELTALKTYLENGGKLLLMRERTDLFGSPEGAEFLFRLVGQSPKEANPKFTIRRADHPWLKHWTDDALAPWKNSKNLVALRTSHGENLIGTRDGTSVLYRLPVGRGELLYIGWTIASALPAGRQPGTVRDEQNFADQMQVLLKLVADVTKPR